MFPRLLSSLETKSSVGVAVCRRVSCRRSGLLSAPLSFLLLLPSPATSFLPTGGIDYKVSFCYLVWEPQHATALCFLVELSSSTLRKVLYLLKIKFERKVRPTQIPVISLGSHSQRFCSTCPVPIKTGISPVSLILTRRPIEFQPSICWGFWEHKAIQKSRETKHALSSTLLSGLINQQGQEESLICP